MGLEKLKFDKTMSTLCSNWFMVSVRRGFIDAFGKMIFQSYSKIDLSRTDLIISTAYLLCKSGLFQPTSAILQALLSLN